MKAEDLQRMERLFDKYTLGDDVSKEDEAFYSEMKQTVKDYYYEQDMKWSDA